MTKKTQNKLRKALLLVCSAMLLVSITVGATYAYLTAQTQQVTNTFAVGNVSFDKAIGDGLDEADVDEYGVVEMEDKTITNEDGTTTTEKVAKTRVTENTYKLIPGHTYTKDPTVHMSDVTEDAWLFVKVENGIAAIEAETNTIAAQMAAKGWAKVEGETNVYAYKETVSAGEDIVVFESFTLAGTADVAAYANASITIKAYAVQADGFATAADAWKAAPTNWADATTGA